MVMVGGDGGLGRGCCEGGGEGVYILMKIDEHT